MVIGIIITDYFMSKKVGTSILFLRLGHTVHSAYTDTIGTRYFISYLRRSLTGGGKRFLRFLLFIFHRKWEMLVFVVEI